LSVRCRVSWLVALLAVGAVHGQAEAPSIADCDARVRAAPGDPDSYFCYVLAARTPELTARARGRLGEVLDREPERFRARLCLAVLVERGDAAQALPLYRESAAGAQAAGDAVGEVFARRGAANLLQQRGDFAGAEVELARAETVARATGDEGLMAWVWADRADQAERLLEHGRARRLYRRAERVAFPDGYPALQGTILSGLGRVSWSLGDLEAARRFFERDAALWQRAGNPHSEAIARYNVALVSAYLARSEPGRERAAALYRAALDAARRGHNPAIEASARIQLATLELEGEARAAELDAAQSIARRARDLETELLAVRALALTEFTLGRERQALARLDEVIERAKSAGFRYAEIDARVIRADLRARGASAEQAREIYSNTLSTIEAIRAGEPDDDVRARSFSRFLFPYYQLSALQLRDAEARGGTEPVEGALRVIERMRARVLLEQLSAAEVRDAIRPPALRELQASLREGEALLSFQLPREVPRDIAPANDIQRAWVIAVTRDAARAFGLPSRQVMEPRIRIGVGLLRRRDAAAAGLIGRLYEDLLGDALAWLPETTGSLVVVPDGPLHRLPLAALRANAADPSLVDRYRVTVVPSATLWHRWRATRGATAGKGVLALIGENGRTRRALPSLPRARREARQIVRELGGELHAGPDALRAILDEETVARRALVHFGAHALVDERRPSRSALVLAATGTSPRDGRLRLGDVSELDLDGQVVVLAACRTARGELLAGEGVIGFSRAFFAAGARTVVASLWPLRDDDAQTLMAHFVRHAADGVPVGEALARARRGAREQGVPTAGWASMVVVGDGRAVVRPDHLTRWRAALPMGVPAALAVLGLLCGAWGVRRLTGRTG
jgi:tetratricopeptide (TPR) repeat protein